MTHYYVLVVGELVDIGEVILIVSIIHLRAVQAQL